MYIALKHLHLTFVALSFLSFFARGVLMMSGSTILYKKWVKIAPHIIDTILLVSALLLMQQIGFHNWIAAKLVALVVYIALGVVALRPYFAKPARISAWLAALATFGYIVSVAITKNPTPWA